MSSTENLRQIREAFQDNTNIDWDLDWDNPHEVWELLAGDGEGGEGISYSHGDKEAGMGFTKTWGQWVLSDEYTLNERNDHGDLIWHHTWTVYPNRAAAKAAYIALIETRQAEGVTWEPDWCPIFDKLEAAWK